MNIINKVYDTALRENVVSWLKEINTVDLLVGIPTFNSEDTISYFISQLGTGLKK